MKEIYNYINNLIENNKKIFTVFFLTIFIVYPYIGIYSDIEFADGFTAINNCLNDFRYFQMTILTNWIGYTWAFIFGEQFIGFRIFSIFISQITFLLPVLFFISKKNNLLVISFLLMISVTVGYQLISWWFGRDIVSNFFIILSFCLINKYFQTNKLLYLFLFGIGCGFSILARFPNIFIIVIFVFLLIISKYHIFKKSKKELIKSILIDFIIVSFVTIITILLIVWLIYGDINIYFSAFRVVKSGRHSLYDLTIPNLFDFIRTFVMIACFSVFFLIYNKLKLLKNYKIKILYVFVIFIIICFFSMTRYVFRLPNSFMFIMVIFLIYDYLKKGISNTTLLLVISIFLFSFISAVGSNCGFEGKLLSSVFFPILLPLIFSKIDFNNKIFVTTIIIALIIGGVYRKTTHPYGGCDVGIFGSLESVNHDKLRYIKVVPWKKELIEDVLLQTNKIERSGKNFLFLGSNELFKYLTKNYPLHLIDDGNYEDNFPVIENYIDKQNVKPIIILMTFNSDRYISLEKKLLDIGYICNEKKLNYAMYRPK